jgi:starch synthase
MGRFEHEMGLDSMIEIVPTLIEKLGTGVKFIFAGAKGPLVEMALECHRTFPNHVVIMNNVPFDLQPSLYAAADIVLTPSRAQHACMGVTIKEAMAASLPVIGSDSGGIPEAIVHNVTGLIVPLMKNGDIDNLAFQDAIISLIGQKDKWASMGAAARERANDLFSEETTINRTAAIFTRCMPKDV